MIRLVQNEREQLRSAAERWKRAYCENGVWREFIHGDTREVYESLRALNVETAKAADVTAIIGNDSWCCPQRCHACNGRFWLLVELGEEPDFESATANACVDCLRKALALAAPPP